MLFAYLLCLLSTQLSATETENFDLQPLQMVQEEPSLISQITPERIEVHNRILAKVNNHPISLMDVTKKMDMLFYQQFAELKDSIEARYRFYMTNWLKVLKDEIDKELILADAKEHQLEISHGDIREEIEEMFGPDVIKNLDQANLSFEEAWQLVKEDITIRRMLLSRANMKAFAKLKPAIIKEKYQEYKESISQQKKLTYQMVTVRSSNTDEGKKIAHQLYLELSKNKTDLKSIKRPSVSVSKEYQNSLQELSQTYKEALLPLNKGEYSLPIAQKSRQSGIVHRIFYLKEIEGEATLALNDVEEKLKQMILHEEITKETENYIKHLYQHYNFSELDIKRHLPISFVPYTLH